MIAARHRHRHIAAVLAAFPILLVGCGDSSGLETRYPVSGTVTYKGAPLEKGLISFQPPDAAMGRVATGTITNGSYRLTTATENDGAIPGSYRVSVESKTVNMDNVLKNAQGGAGRQDDIVKANKKAKSEIPSKYSLADTSGLTFEVKASSNTADFEIKD